MSTIIEGSKGVTIYVETQFDMSSATGLTIVFSGPSGTVRNSTSVSAPADNLTTSACGIFSGNKYVEYITNSGDFSMSANRQSGQFKGYIEADFDANTRLISSNFKFKVCKPG